MQKSTLKVSGSCLAHRDNSRLNSARKLQSLAATFLLLGHAHAAYAFTPVQLCKAAVSSEMGTKLKTMREEVPLEEGPVTAYTRADGKRFAYSCRVQGQRIVWRAYFNDEIKKGWGRWRDGEYDSVIEYAISGNVLNIKNSQGQPLRLKPSDF